MSIVQLLHESSSREVELGGRCWRSIRVSSEDLARAQVALLQILPVDPTNLTKKKKTKSKKVTEDSEFADAASMLRKIGEEGAAKASKMQDAMAVAGVVAVRQEGGEWEEVRLSMKQEDQDPEGKPPTLWNGSLPKQLRDQLGTEVIKWTTEDGEAIARLEAFRERA